MCVCAASPQRWLVPFGDFLCSVEPVGQRRDGEAGRCFPGGQNPSQGETGDVVQPGENEEESEQDAGASSESQLRLKYILF